MAAVALAATLAGGSATYVVGACSTFEEQPFAPLEATAPDPRVDDGALKVDAPSDAGISDAAVVPYCLTLDAALLCNEFPAPPITTGWGNVVNDASGTAEWSDEAGATQPGAGFFSTGPVPGPASTSRLYLSRGVPLPTTSPTSLRLELAVRFDETPDLSSTAVMRLYTGSAVLYVYYSQLGYAFAHSYYSPICPSGPGPCLGGTVDGTKPPILPRTWDHLSITIVKKEAGAGSHLTFEATSGERIDVDSPPGFTPDLQGDSYVDVGFTIVSPGAKTRVFVVDDLSLSAR